MILSQLSALFRGAAAPIIGAMIRKLFAALVLSSGLLSLSSPGGAAEQPISTEQRQMIEQIVRDYLLKHPEVLEEATRALQDKRDEEASAGRSQTLAKMRDEIEKDPAAPVIGNPNGDVTVVEFFDYQCSYCRSVLPTIVSIMENDKKVRYVLKELPILGNASLLASRASIAAWKLDPGKYWDFHRALMGAKPLNESTIMVLAAKAGLDRAKLRKAMDDPAIGEIIQRNYKLAEQLNVTGTPAFVIGDRFVPGALDEDSLKSLISEARGG
jgi:protein-disulfide isomerase